MAIEECALKAEEGRKIAEESYESEATTLYGHDGGQQTDLSYQAQLPAEPVQLSQAMPPAGQQIDLMHLFGKPQAQQQQQHMPQSVPQMNQEHFYQQQQQQQQQQPIQQPKFASNPDTDFFRSSPSPAVQAQAQQPPPQAPSQQNMLLDMLNSARRG